MPSLSTMRSKGRSWLAKASRERSPICAEEATEGRVTRQVAAYRQRIQQQADQPFEFGALAARDRCADDDVVLSGITGQQHLKSSHEQHEQRDIAVARHFLQFTTEFTGQLSPYLRARVTLFRRSRPVRRQFDNGRCAAQLFFPVVQLGVDNRSAVAAALPARVVGHLQRQRIQLQRFAAAARAVKREQFVLQDVE